jgi:ABC-type uncharacterized transport system substrate-binding protein
MAGIRRRDFSVAAASIAVAWPCVAHSQGMPVIGVLDSGSADKNEQYLGPFWQGLSEGGFVEGQNVAAEYRWADGNYDRLPELAADLVRRRLSLIAVPSSTPAALAAKAATSTIPIVFGVGDDPVKLGLVASLSRPDGNATGVNFFIGELVAKRLELLRELVPGAARVAVLVNPTDRIRTDAVVRDVRLAGPSLGMEVYVLSASTIREIDEAFATVRRHGADVLFVSPDSFFNRRRVQLAVFAASYGVPAAYGVRDYAEAGGLISYGTSLAEARRQVGVYAGRILKGVKPADLPVLQPTKFELVINLSAAKAVGLDLPASLLARADEVIE